MNLRKDHYRKLLHCKVSCREVAKPCTSGNESLHFDRPVRGLWPSSTRVSRIIERAGQSSSCPACGAVVKLSCMSGSRQADRRLTEADLHPGSRVVVLSLWARDISKSYGHPVLEFISSVTLYCLVPLWGRASRSRLGVLPRCRRAPRRKSACAGASTTLSGGSLGSCVDEERSQLR